MRREWGGLKATALDRSRQGEGETITAGAICMGGGSHREWQKMRAGTGSAPVVTGGGVAAALPRPPRGDSRARAAYDFYASGASVRRVYGRTGRTRSGGSKARGVTRQTRRVLVLAVRIWIPRGYSPIHRKNAGGCRNWSVKPGVLEPISRPPSGPLRVLVSTLEKSPLGAGKNTRARTCRGPRAPPCPAPRALSAPAVGLGEPDTPI